MKLVEWSSELTSGVGRSGSRYRLSYDSRPNSDTRGLWQLLVDDITVCAVDSAGDAISRSEGLEAMRCILQGLSTKLHSDHLRRAAFIATEMSAAAEKALTLPTNDSHRVEILQSLEALQSLSSMISQENWRRQREADRESLPLLN